MGLCNLFEDSFFFVSFSRAQSVRRTSLRDKTLTTKKDAVEETRLRLQAQEVRFRIFFFYLIGFCVYYMIYGGYIFELRYYK